MKAMLSVITMHKMSNGFNLLAWKIKKPKREAVTIFRRQEKTKRNGKKKIYIHDSDSAIK